MTPTRGRTAPRRRCHLLRASCAALRLRTPLRASLTPLRASLRASSVDTTARVEQQQRRGGRRRLNFHRRRGSRKLYAPLLSRSARRARREAALKAMLEDPTQPYDPEALAEPRTMPGPCGAVMNILREKGEPGLTLQQLMQEVEARGYVPDVIKSKSYLKNNILYSALVNKLMKVRPEGSKFKDHWSIRRPGQVRMGRARFGDVRPGRKTNSRHTHLETPRKPRRERGVAARGQHRRRGREAGKAGTEPGTTGSGSTSLRKGRQFWRSEDLKERPLGKRNEPADPP